MPLQVAAAAMKNIGRFDRLASSLAVSQISCHPARPEALTSEPELVSRSGFVPCVAAVSVDTSPADHHTEAPDRSNRLAARHHDGHATAHNGG